MYQKYTTGEISGKKEQFRIEYFYYKKQTLFSRKTMYQKYFYGIFLCLVIAGISLFFSSFIPLSAVVIAIVFGMLFGNFFPLSQKFSAGISLSEKKFLAVAIALMGAQLNLVVLQSLGFSTLFFIVFSLIFTLFSAVLIGKFFGLSQKFSLLLGIGNAVCGSSAIAATSPILKADEEETGASITIVNLLGVIGMFALPLLTVSILHFSEISSGIVIGNTLQAVGQVVGAGFSVGEISGQTATLIKMTRISLLLPLSFFLLWWGQKNKISSENSEKTPTQKHSIPLFIWGFLALTLLASLSIFPENFLALLKNISHYLLIIAMAGIGLKISFTSISKNGKQALIVGSLVFFLQIVISSIGVYLFL